MVRLVSNSAARLVIEDDVAAVYSPLQNKKDYHAAAELIPEDSEESEVGLEFSLDVAHAIDYIITSWPNPISVDSIPVEKNEDKLDIVKRLFDYGIITIIK